MQTSAYYGKKIQGRMLYEDSYFENKIRRFVIHNNIEEFKEPSNPSKESS